MASEQITDLQKQGQHNNVRYVGAVTGRYILSGRPVTSGDGAAVLACRLCSVSPVQAVIVAPVLAQLDEPVVAHFQDFGMLRGSVVRKLASGFVIDLELEDDGRARLAAKIRWKKTIVSRHTPDKREFKRVLPRHPRTVMTLGDGSTSPCFVIDISQSGVAVSASLVPGIGTPVAIGALLGRVVRHLEIGFAVAFLTVQPLELLEKLMAPKATRTMSAVAA